MLNFIYNIKEKIYANKMKKKWSDWEDNDFNCGDLKFIWGITSWDDLSSSSANLYTMNDIDIVYDREKDVYMLGIETAYLFDNKHREAEYLERLLKAFTRFMIDNNYSTTDNYFLFMGQPTIHCTAKTIPELYTQFRIFVEGYKAVYASSK